MDADDWFGRLPPVLRGRLSTGSTRTGRNPWLRDLECVRPGAGPISEVRSRPGKRPYLGCSVCQVGGAVVVYESHGTVCV
jgi:hypothetical protein